MYAPDFFNELGAEVSTAISNLAAKLHISATRQGNASSVFPLAQKVLDRSYPDLSVTVSEFQGTHNGIVRPSYAEGLRFAYGIDP